MEEFIKIFIGEYGWLFITSISLFFFKSTIENLYYGIRFLYGSEYNVDDIVFINEKKCRIVRQNVIKTTFFIINENKKFNIENSRLHFFIIEKELLNK